MFKYYKILFQKKREFLKYIGYGYAKDWKAVYYNGKIIKDAEVQSFQIISKESKEKHF